MHSTPSPRRFPNREENKKDKEEKGKEERTKGRNTERRRKLGSSATILCWWPLERKFEVAFGRQLHALQLPCKQLHNHIHVPRRDVFS